MPFIPPPPAVPQAALPRVRSKLEIYRALFWRKKPRPRYRRRQGPPGLIQTMHSTLRLMPRQGPLYRRRRVYAIGPTSPATVLQLPAAAWLWTGNALAVNAKSKIVLATASWLWSGKPLIAPTHIVLSTAAWLWGGKPVNISTGTSFITLATAQWRWSGQPLVPHSIWTEVPPVTQPPWTEVPDPGGGPWTPVPPVTNPWQKK